MIELQIFVVAVLVQRQVGGNLAEILRSLAQVVRERFRIQGMVEALTAEGRMQAMVLMALAPFLLVVMLVMNRGYINSLLEAPWLLFSMVGLQALGWLWIRKIVNFEF
jgi:tight adherence protein B